MSFSNIMDSNSYTADGDDDPLIVARERVLGPANRLFYDRPVHLVRGQGSHLFDADGVRYLDAYNNVASVGHCHPHVVEAVIAADVDAEHPYPLSAPRHRRLLRAAAGDHARRRRPGDVCLHRLRGQRPGAARRRNVHGRNGCRDHPRRLSRQHGTAVTGHLAVARRMQRRSAPHVRTSPPPDTYRCRGRGAARFAADVARRCRRPFAERHRGELPHRRHDLLVRRHLSRPLGPRPRGATSCTATAGCSSPTRCSPDSPAPASRCGASTATASSPTS